MKTQSENQSDSSRDLVLFTACAAISLWLAPRAIRFASRKLASIHERPYDTLLSLQEESTIEHRSAFRPSGPGAQVAPASLPPRNDYLDF